MPRIAVYGSLRGHGYNHQHFLKDAHFVEKGVIHGSLFDLGAFPGALFGPNYDKNTIVVEVYDISKETLADVDRLEGHNEANPASGLYRRVKKEVFLDSGEITTTYTYEYNGEPPETSFIPSGDWIEHLRSRYNG